MVSFSYSKRINDEIKASENSIAEWEFGIFRERVYIKALKRELKNWPEEKKE